MTLTDNRQGLVASFLVIPYAYDVANLKCKYSQSLPAFLKIYLSSNHSNLRFRYRKSSQSCRLTACVDVICFSYIWYKITKR